MTSAQEVDLRLAKYAVQDITRVQQQILWVIPLSNIIMSEVQDAIMSWACGYSWERLKSWYNNIKLDIREEQT
jgi:hypothetical protein